MDTRSESYWQRPVGRRGLIAGMAGLGAASSLELTRVLAQDATPSVTDESGVDEDGGETDAMKAEIGAAYQDFVTKLATNLGESDAATVDTAIRDALGAMVEDQFSAGEISRNLADSLIERIQTGEAPRGVAMPGGMRKHRMERRRKRRKDRHHDELPTDEQGGSTSDDPGTESTPSL